ncbi:MAG: hypothetical protein QOI95_483 [Acidimicrobiaceae bacterium]
MKKFLIAAVLATLVASGAGLGVSQAKSSNSGGNPGPNGSNEHGLCTAYFNGQKNGHDKNGNPPPFAALLVAADSTPDDGNVATTQDVFNYCTDPATNPKGIGGNPDENGRFTDCFTDTNNDSSDDCTDG